MTRHTIIWLVVIVVVACGVWLLTTIFSRKEYTIEVMQTKLQMRDTLIAYEKRARLAQQAYSDSLISHLMKDANSSLTQARSNKVYYETAKQQQKDIAHNVAALTDSALRRAITDF